MKQIKEISVNELHAMAERMYGSIVKADVDVTKKILLVDMDMHADGEAYLLEHGSRQADLWGINLHPDQYSSEAFIEFDSMINIRPRQQNPSRDVLDEGIRAEIKNIVAGIVHGCGSSGVTLCGEFRVVRDLVSDSPVSVGV